MLADVEVWNNREYSSVSQTYKLKEMFGCNLEASDSVQNPLIRSNFAHTASEI